MNIIVPMAGMGKRMRPHSLTTPKPLIKVAGKSIVQRLAEDISKMMNDKIENIAFIIGDFGKEVENNLMQIANDLGAKGSIHYQLKAEGTAHAILCAKEFLQGNVIVAFADTLFYADFKKAFRILGFLSALVWFSASILFLFGNRNFNLLEMISSSGQILLFVTSMCWAYNAWLNNKKIIINS